MRKLVAALAVVAVGAVVPVTTAAPAAAAGGYCPKGSGVTVVVDTGNLGGGTSIGCDGQGANTAGSTVVPRAGFPLTYVQKQPGFVCRVNAAPASASCGNTPPPDAYWGLFWSDGKSSGWTYSSVGIGSLKVPAGGFIGWRWQNSNARANPGTAPVSPVAASPRPTPQPAPKPAPKPTPSSPSRSGSQSSSAPSSGPSATSGTTTPPARNRAVRAKATHAARVKAAKQARKKARKQAQQKKAQAKASTSASASSSAAVSGSDDPSSSPRTNLTAGEQATSGSGPMLPVVAAGLLVLLLGAAGRLLWVRRKG
jgi:pyruvate/2-oxoglutarate dehydrogenase complex dihydrolipoamide acyltransferase (E2) component